MYYIQSDLTVLQVRFICPVHENYASVKSNINIFLILALLASMLHMNTRNPGLLGVDRAV